MKKNEQKWEKRDWKESDFDKSIRIKKEKWDYINQTKGQKTLAGRLDEILTDYLGKEVQQK